MAIAASKKDELFLDKESWTTESFVFDKRVVDVFDDMVSRSVPGYSTIQMLVADIALHFENGNPIYDLGCSTGNTIDAILRRAKTKLNIIGIDNSEDMVESCRSKFEQQRNELNHHIVINTGDITQSNIYQHGDPGVVVLNLVMQFVRPIKRKDVLKTVYQHLKKEGCLILVEKTIQDDKLLNEFFINYYHSYKKEMGYSDLEISTKREALENKLIPFYEEENYEMLREAGFSQVTTFFQWMNFMGFMAIK